LHERLEAAAGRLSYRRLGELTRTSPETVRRYMQGHAPSVQFLTDVCAALGINGSWLLTGLGPMRAADVRTHALKQADPAELLTAIADSLTTLLERVDRLEQYMQQVETRVRAVSTILESKPEGRAEGPRARPAQPAAPAPSTASDAPADSQADAAPAGPHGERRGGTDAARALDGDVGGDFGGRLGPRIEPGHAGDGGPDAADRIGRAVTQ
jgi:transcriptional regulator with XRE-family HTH domain